MPIDRAVMSRCCLLALALAALLLTGCQSQPPNEVLRERGDWAMWRKDYAAAEAHYGYAAARIPTDWEAQYGYGRALMKQQRWLDAQLALEKALALRPQHPETAPILDQLAECLFRQGAREQLLSVLDQAVDTYHTSDDFLRLGNYLAKLGDIDAARVAYRKACHFAADDDIKPYLALVVFYEIVGDRHAAVIALRQAYNVNPNNDDVNNRLRRYGVVPGPTIGLPRDREKLPGETVLTEGTAQPAPLVTPADAAPAPAAPVVIDGATLVPLQTAAPKPTPSAPTTEPQSQTWVPMDGNTYIELPAETPPQQ